MSVFVDYSTVTLKSNHRNMIGQSAAMGTGCSDYSDVTLKSKRCNMIGQLIAVPMGCSDYSDVTLKSNRCKEIMILDRFRLFRRHT